MERSLFIELIHRTEGVLNTINKFTQLSREKFGDKEFREFFYRAVNREIENHTLLLNTFLNYLESTTPIPKKGTVTKLMEGVFAKHQVRFEEKRIKVVKKFEENLPETIVPEEQLKFILDSLLQYAFILIPLDGTIEMLTKSATLPAESIEDKGFPKRNGKWIDIVINFTSDRSPLGPSGKGLGPHSFEKDVLSNLAYRLVEMIVRKNQGTIKFETDEKESKVLILLRFPSERRKVVFYQVTD